MSAAAVSSFSSCQLGLLCYRFHGIIALALKNLLFRVPVFNIACPLVLISIRSLVAERAKVCGNGQWLLRLNISAKVREPNTASCTCDKLTVSAYEHLLSRIF